MNFMYLVFLAAHGHEWFDMTTAVNGYHSTGTSIAKTLHSSHTRETRCRSQEKPPFTDDTLTKACSTGPCMQTFMIFMLSCMSAKWDSAVQ